MPVCVASVRDKCHGPLRRKAVRIAALREVPSLSNSRTLVRTYRHCFQGPMRRRRRSPVATFGEFCKVIFAEHHDEKDPGREDGKLYPFQCRDGETAAEFAARIERNILFRRGGSKACTLHQSSKGCPSLVTHSVMSARTLCAFWRSYPPFSISARAERRKMSGGSGCSMTKSSPQP